jgi:nucleoside-diphosphate-sugar epimerase
VAPRADRRGDPRLATFIDVLQPAPLRFVYLSTSGVYGDCAGALVNESRPANPATDRARRRLAAETLLQEWSDARAAELIILRCAAIYGPGRLGMDGIKRGKAIIAETEANPGNRIHVEDLADCCVAAMHGALAPGIYNVADGDHRSPSWFSSAVARLAGLDAPPQIAAAAAQRTFSATRLSFLHESRRLDNAKLLTALGQELRYADAEDGIRASLEAEQQA